MSNNFKYFSNHWLVKVSYACLITLVLAGCGSSNNSSLTTNNDTQRTASPLEGTWDLCGSLRNTYVFNGNTWEQYLAYFDNPECAGPPLSSVDLQPSDEPFAAGTFELLSEITTDSGVVARQLNLTATSVDSATRYDIVFLSTTGEMIFGTFAGFTEEDRPVTLDFDAAYIRR